MNTGENMLIGAVMERTQASNPKTGKWIQFDGHHNITTGIDNPWKRVRKRKKNNFI